MNKNPIIAESLVSGTKSVFVLGCFEKRVTVYAQQVRALNLIDALLTENQIRPTANVAIVGAGFAGMTAAVALAKAVPTLARLDLFEATASALPLQHNSQRYLHPHFYDWPLEGANNKDAGLPIMNWTAGPAGKVSNLLKKELDKATIESRLILHQGQKVTEIIPNDLGLVRVVIEEKSKVFPFYEIVILAIGFGLEAYNSEETPSYWLPTVLTGPVRTHQTDPTIFISGNGDGGLVDFIIASLNAIEHEDICKFLIGLDVEAACQELLVIESEAWQDDSEVNLFESYKSRLTARISKDVWAAITEKLRPDVRVILHTKEKHLFRRTTALHNRFLAFLILEADCKLGRNQVEAKVAIDFVGEVPIRGEIVLQGEKPFSPHIRCLRLGPDSTTNISPFKELLAKYREKSNELRSAVRPESPSLHPSARDRFEKFRSVNEVAAAHETQLLNPISYCISIELNADGIITWKGNLYPQDVSKTIKNSVCIYCNTPVAHVSELAVLFARIGLHAKDFVLHTNDANNWFRTLRLLTSGRALPTPDIDVELSVGNWKDPPPLHLHVNMEIRRVVEVIHDKLNGALLDQLHQELYRVLGPEASTIGWKINAQLSTKIWETWRAWKSTLDGEPKIRDRFLRLLANDSDEASFNSDCLVRLGPEIMRPHLIKPAIFALAFATCSVHSVTPTSNPPGNLAQQSLTGHSCGISWINEHSLGLSVAKEKKWATNVVLLSQLQEAVWILEGDIRMDQSLTDQPRIGMSLPWEEPFILGADRDFLTALENGEKAVETYFELAFRWRAQRVKEVQRGAV
jgi:hypothetical protein